MKVLHVCSSLDPEAGGTTAALIGMVEAQTSAGIEASVIYTFQKPSSTVLADRLKNNGVRVYAVGPTISPLKLHRKLAPICRLATSSVDVVHIHALWEQIQHVAAKTARKQQIPYIISPHGMLDPWSLGQSKLKKAAYMFWRARKNLNRATAIHFTDDAEAQLTVPLDLKAPALVEPLGLDLDEFSTLPACDSFRNKHPQLDEHPFLLFLGRLHPKKGIEILLNAFALLDNPNLMLAIVGPPHSDEYLATLKSMASALGIAERVLMVGMLRGPDRIEPLVDASLFILPSYQENFGIAVVESLACGTPVIISDRVNIHGRITTENLGAVVPPAPEPLAKAIEAWMADADKRNQAATRCREYARKEFDWPTIGRRWQNHYAKMSESILERKFG